MTEYFTFDLEEGETAGLIRRIRDDVLRTSTIEVVSGGKWVDDPDSLKYFEASEAINSTSYPLPRTKPTRKHFRSACPYNFGS